MLAAFGPAGVGFYGSVLRPVRTLLDFLRVLAKLGIWALGLGLLGTFGASGIWRVLLLGLWVSVFPGDLSGA